MLTKDLFSHVAFCFIILFRTKLADCADLDTEEQNFCTRGKKIDAVSKNLNQKHRFYIYSGDNLFNLDFDSAKLKSVVRLKERWEHVDAPVTSAFAAVRYMKLPVYRIIQEDNIWVYIYETKGYGRDYDHQTLADYLRGLFPYSLIEDHKKISCAATACNLNGTCHYWFIYEDKTSTFLTYNPTRKLSQGHKLVAPEGARDDLFDDLQDKSCDGFAVEISVTLDENKPQEIRALYIGEGIMYFYNGNGLIRQVPVVDMFDCPTSTMDTVIIWSAVIVAVTIVLLIPTLIIWACL